MCTPDRFLTGWRYEQAIKKIVAMAKLPQKIKNQPRSDDDFNVDRT